jgi:hypothetical protein
VSGHRVCTAVAIAACGTDDGGGAAVCTKVPSVTFDHERHLRYFATRGRITHSMENVGGCRSLYGMPTMHRVGRYTTN